MEIQEILEEALRRGASDVHLMVGILEQFHLREF